MAIYNYFYKIDEGSNKVIRLKKSLLCDKAFILTNIEDIVERYNFPTLPIVKLNEISDRYSLSDQIECGDLAESTLEEGKNHNKNQLDKWDEELVDKFISLNWLDIKNDREDYCMKNSIENYAYWIDFSEENWNILREYFIEIFRQIENEYYWYTQK